MSAKGSRRRWLAAGFGIAMIVGFFVYPVSGFPNGYWRESPNPVVPCEEGPLWVCAEWITGGEESLYQPCCIRHEALRTPDLSACGDPLVGKRPSEF